MTKGLFRKSLAFMAVLMLLSQAACGSTSNSQTAMSAPGTTAPAATTGPVATKASVSTTPTASGQKKELKIGVVSPMTGPGAAWGIAWEQAAIMAANDINDKGGLKIGGDTYTIKLITYDDKYTGDVAVTAVTRLINENNVKFIIGPMASAGVLAARSVSEPAQVLLLTAATTADAIGPKAPFTVRIALNSQQITPGLYSWIKGTYPNVKKVAFLNPNDASGKGCAADSNAAAKYAGYEIVADEYYERGTTDFYPVGTKMLAKNPDLIDIGITPPGDSALFLKQIRELGYKGLAAAYTPLDVDTLVKVAGSAAEGHIGTLVDRSDPGVVAFMDKYKKAFPGGTWNDTLWYFYPAELALFQTMEKAQSIDVVKVRDAYLSSKHEGILGTMVFGGKKMYGVPNQIYYSVSLGQVKDGKVVVVGKIDATKLPDASDR